MTEGTRSPRKCTIVELRALLDRVEDEASFVAFLQALAEDFAASARLERDAPSSVYGPVALGWESVHIDDFLEAAAAWANDSTDEIRALSRTPWHRCAAMLLMGKLYE